MFNSIVDRALSEHTGSGLFMKKQNGKYSLLLPIEGTGENGSTPDSLEKTAIGNKSKTYVEGRTDNPQKTIPFYAHRDNLTILEGIKGEAHEFLRVLPDFTAMKFSGTVNYKLNNTDVGNLEQGEITITVTVGDEYVANAYGLIEDTALITNDVDDTVIISGTASKSISITTDPSDATVTATSESSSVATATYSSGIVTITGVASGSTVVTISVSKSGYASFNRSVLVIVE